MANFDKKDHLGCRDGLKKVGFYEKLDFLAFDPAVTAGKLGFSLDDLEGTADFDGHIFRKVGHTYCGSGVFSVFAKNLHGKFAGAVQYGRLFMESGGGLHKTLHLDQAEGFILF